MKKIVIVTFLIVIAISGFTLYKFNDSNPVNQSKSIASAVIFEDFDDMTSFSDVVIKGQISKDFIEFERQLTDKVVKEHLYKVIVTEVLNNNLGDAINIGDELTITQAISFKQENYQYDLLDGNSEELETGSYLLFLNQNPEDVTQYTIVSPNHIYKENNKEEYVNIIKGVELNKISKQEISIIKDAKKK